MSKESNLKRIILTVYVVPDGKGGFNYKWDHDEYDFARLLGVLDILKSKIIKDKLGDFN